jgi:hypothetical protein
VLRAVVEHIADPRLTEALDELRERLADRGHVVSRITRAYDPLARSTRELVDGSGDGRARRGAHQAVGADR